MVKLFRRAISKISQPIPKVIDGRKVGFQSDYENGWFRRDRSELASGFPITSVDTVIDVGCGEGGISAFAGDMGAEVISADIDPAMVEITKNKMAKTKAKSYQVIQTDCNPLPVPDQSCSRIIALEVLEHVDDPAQFMRELVRVAKPNALFLLAVPDKNSESVQQGIAPPAYWQKPNHVRIFERDAFDELVRGAGLSIEQRQYKNFFWAMWWTLFWATEHKKGDPEHEVLHHWTMTWHTLQSTTKGKAIAKKLDEFMPKSQVIVARKAA